jgi:hypothetical protein
MILLMALALSLSLPSTLDNARPLDSSLPSSNWLLISQRLVLLGLVLGRMVSNNNVLHKRVDHTSEWIKILYISYSMTQNTSNIEDIETKQIALSSTYPNSVFARSTLATSKWYSFGSTS